MARTGPLPVELWIDLADGVQVLLDDEPGLLGSIVDVRITAASRWSTFGEIVLWVLRCPGTHQPLSDVAGLKARARVVLPANLAARPKNGSAVGSSTAVLSKEGGAQVGGAEGGAGEPCDQPDGACRCLGVVQVEACDNAAAPATHATAVHPSCVAAVGAPVDVAVCRGRVPAVPLELGWQQFGAPLWAGEGVGLWPRVRRACTGPAALFKGASGSRGRAERLELDVVELWLVRGMVAGAVGLLVAGGVQCVSFLSR
jgi:hypothetical protein